MTRNSGGRNIASAVRETLDSIVSPSVRDTILARALGEARQKELPAEPADFDNFIRGPLHDELVRALGPELGTSVAEELERVSALANRDVKTRDKAGRTDARTETVRPGRKAPAAIPSVSMPVKQKPSRSTLPSPGMSSHAPPTARERPGALSAQPVSADFPAGTAKALGVIGTLSIDPRSGARPSVYVASHDADMVRSFQTWLAGRALVQAVGSAGELVQALAQPSDKRSVVVLDGKNPAIRPLTLAALADELPPGTSVLLWGVPPHVHARMCTVSAVTEKWLVASGETSPTEVVARCVKIVG